MGILKKLFGKNNSDKLIRELVQAREKACAAGQWRVAIRAGNQLAQIFINSGDKKSEGVVYNNMAGDYLNLGDTKKAIAFNKKALNILKDIDDREYEGACYSTLGSAYRQIGDYKKAIKYHERVLQIAEDINNWSLEFEGYTALGHDYLELKKFNKAIESYEKALGPANNLGLGYGAGVHIYLAEVYERMQNPKKARKHNEIAQEIFGLLSLARK